MSDSLERITARQPQAIKHLIDMAIEQEGLATEEFNKWKQYSTLKKDYACLAKAEDREGIIKYILGRLGL